MLVPIQKEGPRGCHAVSSTAVLSLSALQSQNKNEKYLSFFSKKKKKNNDEFNAKVDTHKINDSECN